MAASREQRRNAGNRMSRALDEEINEDDFYKTTYGGFAEEEEDNDFRSDQEDSADEVDSDFDRSENDELISDDDESKRKKKRKGVSTKAYKEPVAKKPAAKKTGEPRPQKSADADAQAKDENDLKRPAEQSTDGPSRKSSRKATATNSLMTNLRQKERKEIDKKKREVPKKAVLGIRRLTQEELLAEAEKTEKKNLKSLENFQKLEASRKKSLVKKRHFDGPTIKLFSTYMPNATKSSDNVVIDDCPADDNTANESSTISRNFLVFSDRSTLDACFAWKKMRPPTKMMCPVTKKLARFVDPLTKIPYHDMYAFKQIREAYNHTIRDLKERSSVK